MKLSSLKHTVINYYKGHSKLVILWAAAILLSIFYSPYLSSLIATLPFAYILTSRITRPMFFSSKFYTAAAALMLFIAIFQISLYLGWFFVPETTFLGTSLITLILILLIILLLPESKNTKGDRRAVSTLDLIAITGGVIVLLFVAGVPIYKSMRLDAKYPLINLMTRGGVDSPTHLSVVNDRLQFDKGVLTGTEDRNVARHKYQGYPIGWHSANTLLIKSVNPSVAPGLESAHYYIVTTLFWLFMMTYFLIRTSGALVNNILKTKVRPLSLNTLLFMGILSMIVFFSDLFIHGFYSFFPVVVASILFIPAIISLYNSKNADELCHFLIMPVFILSLSALSWLLVAPVFGLSILLVILERAKKLKNIPYRYLASILLVVTLTIATAAIQTQNTSTSETGEVASSFLSTIVLDGGIAKYAVGFYIVIVGLSILYFKCASRRQAMPVVIYVTAATLFISLIYLIQQYKQLQNTYYYYKLLTVITTVLWTVGVAGLASFVHKLRVDSMITSLSIAVAMPILILFIFIPSPNLYAYTFGVNISDVKRTDQLVDLLQKYHTMSHYGRHTITIYDPAGSPHLTEFGSVFLKTNNQNSHCYSTLFNNSFMQSMEDFDISGIAKEECRDFKVVYVVKDGDIDTMNQKSNNANLANRIILEPMK